jgi:Ca2+-binding RTX toxin-like protein
VAPALQNANLGAAGAPSTLGLTDTLSLSFSENIRTNGSTGLTLRDGEGVPVTGDLASWITISGGQLTLRNTAPWLAGTTYTLGIAPGAIQDAAGNGFIGGSLLFRTAANVLAGTPAADVLAGTTAGDAITGGVGNDRLSGLGGSDLIDGGAGIDTASFRGQSAQYRLSWNAQGQALVTDTLLGRDGADSLTSVERLEFSNRTVTLDSRSHSGFGDIPATMYQFFILAFGAAPGVEYLQQCADAYRAGADVKRITNVFCSKSQFTDIYPTSLSNRELATQLVGNVVGTSATQAAKDEAINDIAGALNNGLGVGDMIFTVFSNLAAKTGDAKWGGTAQLFFNQIAVAKYYTEVLNQNTTDRATLASAIAMVKAESDVSNEAAIVTLIGQGLLGG